MMKRILVPLTGREADRQALDAAFALARPFSGHVEGIFVRLDPRDAVPMLGEGMSGALVDEIMRTAEAEAASQARMAADTFAAAASAAAAETCERPPGPGRLTAGWVETTGRADEVVPVRARLVDVVVFSRVGLDTDPALPAVFEAALMGSARPVLLAPAAPLQTLGRSVAIAWNGGLESARAVAAAMPLLRRAETVHVLTAETSVTSGESAGQLSEYLAWQGISAKVQRINPGIDPVGGALTARAMEAGADLLVIGAYGHSRLREMILGGVTRHVVGNAALPVLMAH
ncbi:universal stress protein [Arenibaculum pallidiluteum]|uniref:universal stress protein n=1 Tax=Arenibaculum pallidiluteum TaxID=2812559 RepID=UPI001A95E2B5|nr:universal stress protein [Arenibaculum pallidiluteum]